MSVIEIHLQEGFEDDLVAIRVNGREFAAPARVTTRLLLGVAETLRAECEPGGLDVEIELPERGIRARHAAVLEDRLYLAVSRVGERLTVSDSAHPIGYA